MSIMDEKEYQKFVMPKEYPREHYDFIIKAIPKNLKGKSVLDIGARDGHFSFLAEQRGANRVLAIDIVKSKRLLIAKKTLNSKVEYRLMDVLNLNKLDEKFDVVFFFGVLYHLRHPLLAIERIYPKVRKLLIIESEVVADSRPILIFNRICQDSDVVPSISWISEMCRSCGFRKVELVATSAAVSKSIVPPIKKSLLCLVRRDISTLTKGIKARLLGGTGRALFKVYK